MIGCPPRTHARAPLPAALALVLLAACASEPAETASSSPEATAAPEAEASPAITALCGSWQADNGDGTLMVERWRVEGEGLRGEGRTTNEQGEVLFAEQLEILTGEDGALRYRAQPGEEPVTEFRAVDPSARRFAVELPDDAEALWLFANYEHDFPQEISYALLGDRLEIRIAGPKLDAPEELASAAWSHTRTEACPEGGAP
jgi:hypothetical protein